MSKYNIYVPVDFRFYIMQLDNMNNHITKKEPFDREQFLTEQETIYDYLYSVYCDARTLITDDGVKKYPDLVIESMLQDIEQDIRKSLKRLEFDYYYGKEV